MGLVHSWWAVLAFPAAMLLGFAFSSVCMALTTYMKSWQDFDKVTRDMRTDFAFNTAISAVMELTNEIYRQRDSASPGDVRFAIATAGSLIFPFAPHLASEVYELMTGRRVWEEPWPEADPALLERDEIQLVVQVNGKLIDRLPAPASATQEQLEELARGSDKLAARLNGKEIVKTVVVPGKLVNFVVA